MTNTRTNAHITAQVAVEAIINCEGDGYEQATMRAVWDEAHTQGVASLYIDMLTALIIW